MLPFYCFSFVYIDSLHVFSFNFLYSYIFVASAGTSFPSKEPWTCVTLTFADFSLGVTFFMVSNLISSGNGVAEYLALQSSLDFVRFL